MKRGLIQSGRMCNHLFILDVNIADLQFTACGSKISAGHCQRCDLDRKLLPLILNILGQFLGAHLQIHHAVGALLQPLSHLSQLIVLLKERPSCLCIDTGNQNVRCPE
jgi:hypothetical protein